MNPPADAVLLLNTRADKGFDFLLEVAALLPARTFVCVASQTEPAEAEAKVAALGLANVTILPRTDDVAALYRAARIVAVPSYRFRETFSRVCIEAQRFGRPVLGAASGNIPFLLAESGIVLPEEPWRWADEIERLFADEAHHAAAVARAFANSARFSAVTQRQDLRAIVAAAAAPVAIALGSGLGNMIHVAPLVRRMAAQLGHPIDLIVAEDHDDSLPLLHDPQWVNAVWSLRRPVLGRRYELIFVTHSFGAGRVPFAAERVVRSRDWQLFRPEGELHEAVFNLEAAKQLLGIDYTPDDAARAWVATPGDVARDPRLVGLHGGSKDGMWAAKRWPHFPALADALRERGWRVACFGLPFEAVPGTEDRTGGSIAEMIRGMRACAAFVSNDSGLMNIANALGLPLLTLFAPTDWRTRGPLAPASRSLALEKACSPCEWRTPELFRTGACRCIGEIELADVLAGFEAMTGGEAPARADPVRPEVRLVAPGPALADWSQRSALPQ